MASAVEERLQSRRRPAACVIGEGEIVAARAADLPAVAPVGEVSKRVGGSNSVVESQPSKLLVAGSIPVSRSNFARRATRSRRASVGKPSFARESTRARSVEGECGYASLRVRVPEGLMVDVSANGG